MELTFCPHCRKQITGVDEHDCLGAPEGYEGPAAVTVTLNRRQRRQAIARAKKRIAKEKKS